MQKAEVLCSDGQPVTPERKAAVIQEYVEQNRRIREAAAAAQKERRCVMLMKIRSMRRAAGMTRKELSLSMGVAPYVVEQWECETALPRTRELPLWPRCWGVASKTCFADERARKSHSGAARVALCRHYDVDREDAADMTRKEIIEDTKAQGGMYAVIPSVVMLDDQLSVSARMLYGVIVWACNQNACTWASNRALGAYMGLSPKRISELIAQLEKQGHIETEVVRDTRTNQVERRYIYPVVKSSKGCCLGRIPLSRKIRIPPPKLRYTLPEKSGSKRTKYK